MGFPASPFIHPTFEDALDDLVEDWMEDEDPTDIIAALTAKAESMQVDETKAAVAKEAIDAPDGE